jgi:hypothetical protein
MHRLSTIAFAGMLSLTLSGCGSETKENNAAAKPTTSTPEAAPQQPAPQSTSETFAKPPVLAPRTHSTGFSTAGLIQSTNPNQRTKQVQTGRSDPFAALFTIPVTTNSPKVAPSLPKITPVQPQQPVAVKPTLPLPPPMAPQPVAPQPDLAKDVVVMGVVEVGNGYQAIVKVPNEATSRYVSEGQRLSDGRILVKRIEMNPGFEPLVILEENGIEVTRAVGQEPAKPEENKSGQPTAAIPVPPSPSTGRSLSVAELKTLLQTNQPPSVIPAPPPPPPTGGLSTSELKSKLKIARPLAAR